MGIEGRLQFLHPDDRLRLLHFNEKVAAAKDGEVLTLEYRISQKSGDSMWIRNRSQIFKRNKAGKVTHLLGLLQDITEEKEASARLKELNESLAKKNKDLEGKNDEITSFAFVASHDLREPIRKLHTFADFLMITEPTISENGKRSLQRMTSAIHRLDGLIDDIMGLSQAHLMNEKQKEVDLNRVLQNVITGLADEIETAGAKIEAGHLPQLTVSETLLFSLFENLISNSLKFRRRDTAPVIKVTAANCVEGTKKGIRISFTDNGIGFPQEYSKKIFIIFQRLHNNADYEGTGMGLAICKKIMEKHNGTITATSEAGKGATFTCWFPEQVSIT
jgi:light-regulated signal transduction histidine kinase (bacteriophytochrome)